MFKKFKRGVKKIMKKAEELIEARATVNLKIINVIDKYIGWLYTDLTKDNTLLGIGVGFVVIGVLNKLEKQEDYKK